MKTKAWWLTDFADRNSEAVRGKSRFSEMTEKIYLKGAAYFFRKKFDFEWEEPQLKNFREF